MPRLVDVNTGEVHYVGIVRKKVHDEPFALLFQHAVLELIIGPGRTLTALHWRVLLHLVATAEYDNIVDQHVSEIAALLGHHYTAISRALTRLEALDLIRREDRVGLRPRRIVLNPRLVYRGNAAQRAAALRDQAAKPQADRADDTPGDACAPDPAADSGSA